MKFCKDCTHVSYTHEPRCYNPLVQVPTELYYITGVTESPHCLTARKDKTLCTPEAIYFEPRL